MLELLDDVLNDLKSKLNGLLGELTDLKQVNASQMVDKTEN